jgi:hypothetical protein
MSGRRACGGIAGARLLVGMLLVLAGGRARAHELTPSLLSIVERAHDPRDDSHDVGYDVLWRVPIDEAPRALFTPVLPADATSISMSMSASPRPETRSVSTDSAAHYESWSVRIPGGLPGRPIALDGPAGAASDALVRIAFLDGRVVHGRLVSGGPPFVVPAAPSRLATAVTYLRLGVEHILLGFDHLLFVLGLLMLAGSVGAMVRTITAFTVAHSLTLALAALGVVHVPQAPAEATIALSIVFVARELAIRGRAARSAGPTAPPSLASRRPWLVAGPFGLVHGLGFAGALAEIGLPAREVPLALAAFNIGVELGQLAFVGAVSGLFVVAAAAWRARGRVGRASTPRPTAAARAQIALGYGIGVVAAVLCIGRIAMIVRP